MRVLSVNVGLPREVEWRNEPVTTAIHKAPISGPVQVRRLNLDVLELCRAPLLHLTLRIQLRRQPRELQQQLQHAARRRGDRQHDVAAELDRVRADL